MMKPGRVFIGHSSKDKEFANLVVEQLRSPDMAPWIDGEQIIAGDDIFDQIGQGLQSMDTLVFLVSTTSLQSEWVALEVKYTVTREITERRVLLQPFIIDDLPISALPWFLSHRNVSRVTADASGAVYVANAVRQALQRRSTTPTEIAQEVVFRRDLRIEELIRDVGVGDWDAARDAAIEVLKETDEAGHNELFEALLRYQDYPNDEDTRWGAIITVESLVELAPWLVDHKLLDKMAKHPDFSIRSSAASICMSLAQFAPDRVPVDILLRLATHDEDWYVTAPATAALQAMVRHRPAILRVFFKRLHSLDPHTREHAAQALAGIAHQEPGILDPGELEYELSRLEELADEMAAYYIAEAFPKVKRAKRLSPYKYGL